MRLTPGHSSHRSQRPGQGSGTGRAGRWVHLIGAVAMVLGLFLPLTNLGQAIAAPNDASSIVMRQNQSSSDTVPPAPVQVAAIGDFQQQLGCADFDPFCQQSQLFNSSGIWSGVFSIPGGDYSWQIAAVAQDGTVFTYGQGGLGGGPQQVSVGDGQAGVYFELDTHTNDVVAEPVDSLYTVQIDGTTLPLRPVGGELVAFVSSQGGGANVQVLANSEPLTEPQIAELNPGTNRLVFNTDGQLLNVESVSSGSLTVQRLDATGNSLGGGCYQLRSGNTLVNQGCDADDGTVDGNTFMVFPEGVPGGNVTVVEVTPPDGADAIADQDIALEPGDSVVTLQPAAAAAEGDGDGGDVIVADDDEGQQVPDATATLPPEDETEAGPPGDLIVTLQTEDGQPIGGACFQLLDDSDSQIAESCDTAQFDQFPENGNTGFFGVPSGAYTLRLSDAPDGVTADDREIEILGGQEVTEVVTASGAEPTPEPTEEATAVPTEPAAGVGDVVVLRQDQQGNPVGGSCFEIVGPDGSIVAGTVCDEDGDVADDGRIGFFDVPEGDGILRETRTPEGYEQAPDQQITAQPDSVVEIAAASSAVATEEPTASETEEATQEPTAEETEQPTQEATATDDEQGPPGDLLVTLQDASGNPVGNSCYQLLQGDDVVAESCDTAQYEQSPGNGTTGFYGVPSGTYTLRNTENPGGQPLAEDREIEVVAGEQVTEDVQLSESGELSPTAESTQAPTETEEATVEPTEAVVEPIETEAAATEEPTVATTETAEDDAADSEPGPPGDVIVTLVQPSGEPVGGACFQIEMDGQPPIEVCDSDDPFPDNGNTGFFGVPSGTYSLTQTQTPDGINPIEPQEITIQPGQNDNILVSPAEGAGDDADTNAPVDGPGGNVRVNIGIGTDQALCIELNTGGAISLADAPIACDNEENDASNEFGVIVLENVPAGSYVLSEVSGAVDVPSIDIEVVEGETTTVQLGEAAGPTQVPEPTATPEPTPTPEPTTGTLTITVTDADGNALGGACFDVSNSSGTFNFCDEDGDGVLDISDVVFDTQTVTQTASADGYSPVPEQQVDVTLENQAAELSVVNELATGAIRAVSVDDAGNPLGGACVALDGGEPLCDEDGDGVLNFEEVSAGEHAISQTTAPEGYQSVDDQTVNVEAGGTADVTFTNAASTGTIRVVSVDDAGNPLGGACVALDGGEPLCDEDGDGVLNFEEVSVGEHTISQTTAPEGYQSVDDQTVNVEAGGTADVTFTNTEATGAIVATVNDSDGNPVDGVCVSYSADGGDPVTLCESADGGNYRFDDVSPGSYSVTVSEVPEEYTSPDPVQVEVVADQDASVSFELALEPPQTGSAILSLQTEDGQPAVGICLQLTSQETGDQLGPFCDNGNGDSDGAEGVVLLENIPVGVWEVTFPDLNAISMSLSSGGSLHDVQGSYALAQDDAPITIEILPGQTIEEVITVPGLQVLGSIQIRTEDANTSDPVEGACYTVNPSDPTTVCDNGDGDASGDPGVVLIENLPQGEYTVSQPTAPEGYDAAEDQTVTVNGGATAELTFANALSTGSITAKVNDADGSPVEGVCVEISSETSDPQNVCEPADGGEYRFEGVIPGAYTVEVTQVPDDYVAPDPVQVEVVAGEAASVSFELAEAPPETGSALLSLETEDGQAAEGICLRLVSPETGEELGPFCDNDERDGDATEGVILLQDVPVGAWNVVFDESGAFTPAEVTEAITIDITPGVTIDDVITVPGLQVFGSIEIRTEDADTGELVAGACYAVDSSEPIEVCHGGAGDASSQPGIVLIENVPQSDYTVSMTTAPDGYGTAADQNVSVTGGETATLTFEVAAEDISATLVVNKVDDAGEPLPGACFRLQDAGGVVAEGCDSGDGSNDGTITFSDVPASTYQLVETRTPSGEYQAVPNRSVEVRVGETTTVEVVNSLAPGRLYVIKVAANDPSVRLDDACFSLQGESSYGPFCDGDDLTVDGRTVFTNVRPGTYSLVETQAPAGYDPADDRDVTIRPAVTLQLTVQNAETPPPPEAGTLVVNKLGADGASLAGGCFRLFDGDTPVTGQVCDITDGTNDGRIVFDDVPAGTWTLRETLAPSPSYRLAADQQVTIEDDTTTEVDVVNRFKTGRVLVRKVTEQGDPIPGACFDLASDGRGQQCSNANGELLFDNVAVGDYRLNETVVPYGFRQADPVGGITVNPGQTTVITVENVRQPPPNTGSVQVLKFVCPVETTDDERTVFLGGAAGNAELAETQGCSQADAEFTLVGEDGSGGPGAFQTGEDGQYQVTVPEKVYRLDETNPDLPGNSAALLRVETGRLTTVVVINYVAPPAPKPVDISVAKYTCQAGFNGTTFEDFAASCMDDSQLTNNITVRAEGPVDLRAVTGDGGEKGRTAFVDQPSGAYTIYEERPYNIPTNYGFCGWNGNYPADFKTVNGAITAELGEGAGLSCVFFNIPEPVTDSTGVILVRKYTCDVDEPPKGYEFAEECRLSDENQTFELKQYNEETTEFGDGTQQTANPDGILRFVSLRPGTYQLREVDSNWCYANSNSVNTNGDVVVKAGQVSLVSIYNCVGPATPPNTGSGDAADEISPLPPKTPTPEGVGVSPDIAWPVLVIALVFALWPRRVQAPDWELDDIDRDAA